ncbi:MAG TPA: FAD binding domain-containing protein [Longimicrobiaceae bacterium]|nr:FAD binding domain-containing protein [Longimicrobiaceae bacterium]
MLRLHQYQYHRPSRLDEAIALLDGREDAMPIAGGTDLVPNMKHRLFTPDHIVGLKGVREMKGFGLTDALGAPAPAEEAAQLVIGAAETLSTVSRNPLVRRHYPSLARAAGLIAGPQIRNQGTIGGNLCLETRCTYYNQSHFWRQALGYCLKKDGDICHVTKVGKKCVAAASADTPPVLITLGAMVDLASADGTRSVPVEDFFVADGVWNTVRRPDELVVRVRIPLLAAGTHTAYEKVRQRNSIDFPLLSIALAAGLDDDSTVRSISLVVSALGSRPRVVTGLEKIAVGLSLDEAAEPIALQAFKQSHPLENIIVDTEWRRAMVPIYVRRALRQIGVS